jgi:hypothetical protein
MVYRNHGTPPIDVPDRINISKPKVWMSRKRFLLTGVIVLGAFVVPLAVVVLRR